MLFKEEPKKRDYLSLVLRDNADKVPPGHYNPPDFGQIQIEVKKIRFSYAKAPRKTIIEEMTEQKKLLPCHEQYNPKPYRPKIIGSPRQ